MGNNLLHTPEGVRDIYGKEYAKKLALEKILREKLVSFGYDEIQTPTFEYFDVFSKEIGTTSSRDLYKFFDKEGDTLVLRPDFTPSIARCAAKYYMEDSSAIRFCYIGNTFTNTSNLQGKLKEVTQAGAELLGDNSIEADAEMINLVIEALQNCGLSKFQISIGQVEFFKGLCEEAGLSEDIETQLREFISSKNFSAARELLTKSNVSEEICVLMLDTTKMFGDIQSLQKIKQRIHNDRSIHAIERLENIYHVLNLYGSQNYVSFDLGMLSKYRYYTGIIFRAYTYGVGDAIVKGGRYDSLLKHFGKHAPAVGFAIVVDDLLEAVNQQNISLPLPEEKIILSFTKESFHSILEEAQHLRSEGKTVEMVRKDECNE